MENQQDSIKIVNAYQNIFKDILPNAVKTHGLGIPYWESSPSSKGGSYDDWKSGDSHYWGVWWGQEPFDAYRTHIGRFMSEYGFQSFPEFNTVKTFTNESDWDIYSDVMKAHQRSSIGNGTISNYMARHFNEPKDFKHYLFMSQLLQAEGVKVAMEAHRIKKPFNMGSLVWHLNDCWPVASWSSIDYFGRWKALHYYIKRAFEDVIVAFEDDSNRIKLYGITDQYEELKANLVVELIDLNGKVQSTEEKNIKLKVNSSEEIWKKTKKELLKRQQESEVYLRAKIVLDQKVIAENTFLFVPHKDLELEDPNINYDFIEKDDKLFVELKSNKAAFGVCFDYGNLNLRFSDNYFTLHAKEPKLVEIISDTAAFEIKNKLSIKSLTDSYMP